MIAIITFSSYSITCWLMDIAVTVGDTAWIKCCGLVGTSLNKKVWKIPYLGLTLPPYGKNVH